MNDQVAAAAAAIRRLRPPAGASEAWVRQNGVAISGIAEAGGLDRPTLIAALFSAGVAQKSDRNRPLGGTAVSRALAAGRKSSADRQQGIDLQKIEAAITKVVAGLLPGVTEKIARQAAAEALRLAAQDSRAAAAQTPAAAPQPVAEPAPASKPAQSDDAFAALSSAFEKSAPTPSATSPSLDQLRGKPLHQIIGRKV